MSLQRVIIALTAFAAVAGVLFVDWRFETHIGSLLLLTALSALALAEVYPLLGNLGFRSFPATGVAGLVLLFLARGGLPLAGLDSFRTVAVVLTLFACFVAGPLVVPMFRAGAKEADGREEFERAATTAFGLLLVWFLLSFLLELRLLPMGLSLAVLLVLSVKIGDSTAYLVGRTVGKHKLTWISPKKTWEGAAGCLAGSLAVCLGLGIPFGFPWWGMLVFGTLTSVAGQLGDLLESLLKRRAGVKDSGTLFKEIGGFLDILDSLLLAAPVGYLVAVLLLV
ncbi:MAG: phosphatidate cytidylyltransferase [Planctomycetes bacterium]|nr:phosphatidate cytidylyltransferase [Planctomycetota bacterium]